MIFFWEDCLTSWWRASFTITKMRVRWLQFMTKDLISDQGDVTLVVEYDNKFPGTSMITSVSEIPPSAL